MSRETISFKFPSFEYPSAPPSIVKLLPKQSTISSKNNLGKPGLCFWGQCQNPECTPGWKWAYLGYGNFNVAQKIRTSNCPDCGKYLRKVQRVAIVNCLLVGKGQRATGNEDEEEVEFEHSIYSNDSGLIFGQIEEELVLWNYLTLKSTLPKKCHHGNVLGPYKKCYTDWTCYNCKNDFTSTDKSKFCCYCRYHLCWDCL